MRRRLPPLEQIEAFIEAAEQPTFRAAAERCALSLAAFSRRVQAFSAYAGVVLFERTAGGLRLTDCGRRCLEELKPAFLELRRAAAQVGADHDLARVRRVTLSLSHSLAVGWLIPRLDRFRIAHPELELSLRTQRDASDIRRGDADLGICFDDVDVGGLHSQPLLDVAVYPAASPTVARAIRAAGGRLDGQPLLAVSRPPDLWAWWAGRSGFDGVLTPAANFDLLHAMYEIAAEGLGVALAASPTVTPHLRSGRLVRLDLPAVRFPGGYRLAAAEDRRRRRPVQAVWRWLESEARRMPDPLAVAA
jgi:LysR family glycine cleavage system transcriptional activator